MLEQILIKLDFFLMLGHDKRIISSKVPTPPPGLRPPAPQTLKYADFYESAYKSKNNSLKCLFLFLILFLSIFSATFLFATSF